MFNTSPIRFPTLAEISFDKRVHLKDGLITTNQKDFIQSIHQIVSEQCKLTPVTIVSGNTYKAL
jgi:hypothetical protein